MSATIAVGLGARRAPSARAPPRRRGRRLEAAQVARRGGAACASLIAPACLAQLLPVGQLAATASRAPARMRRVAPRHVARAAARRASASRAAAGKGRRSAPRSRAGPAARISARCIARTPAPAAGAARRRCASGTTRRRRSDLGAASRDGAHLSREHRQRDVGVLDREGAAEAAALGGARQLDQLEPAHRAQQPHAAGRRRASDAQRVAGRVVGDAVRRSRADVLTPRRSTRNSESSCTRGASAARVAARGRSSPALAASARRARAPSPTHEPRAPRPRSCAVEARHTRAPGQRSASAGSPVLTCIWPQQVCAGGKSTCGRAAPAPAPSPRPSRGRGCRPGR